MSERKIILALLALVLIATPASAQGGLGRLREPRAGAPGRQQLEARLRQRLWSITKNRVGFSDEQMTKLAQTSRGFDQRRRQLAADERQQRQLLRREILAGSAADQSQVATALDRVLQIQRERIDLQIQEQRAFAEFMTPSSGPATPRSRSSCAAEPRSSAGNAWVRTRPSARTTYADLRSLVAGSAHRAPARSVRSEYSDRPRHSIDCWSSRPGWRNW